MGHGASVDVNMYIYYYYINIEIFHQFKISHFTLFDPKICLKIFFLKVNIRTCEQDLQIRS